MVPSFKKCIMTLSPRVRMKTLWKNAAYGRYITPGSVESRVLLLCPLPVSLILTPPIAPPTTSSAAASDRNILYRLHFTLAHLPFPRCWDHCLPWPSRSDQVPRLNSFKLPCTFLSERLLLFVGNATTVSPTTFRTACEQSSTVWPTLVSQVPGT